MSHIILLDGTEYPLNAAYNGDCLEFMKMMPDKCIDLVLTDPPYGIGDEKLTSGGTWASKYKSGDAGWDKKPEKEIFDEIFRISKHQIIWGGNYFSDFLPSSRGFIIWDKIAHMETMADCEYAWISYDKNAKIFKNIRNTSEKRIHITQKPLRLFKWCLEKYAPENAIVFDPFLGSFTTAVACHSYGLNWIGAEKDPDYFEAGLERYNREKSQLLMEF